MSRLRMVAIEAWAVLRDIGEHVLIGVGFVTILALAFLVGCLVLGVPVTGRFP